VVEVLQQHQPAEGTLQQQPPLLLLLLLGS
jgi:hypothetical protein